jgi:hypothetical protein
VSGTYDCDSYGGDCTDCADPGSADNQEGGECFDMVVGCTDETADNYNPDANTDDGSCVWGGCAEGLTLGCSDQDIADGDCASDGWIGDGYCDGYAEAYGVNFCCFDNDGGDCTDEECSETVDPGDWDAEITGLTATGLDYELADGTISSAIQFDWDDLSDGDEGCAPGTVEDCDGSGECWPESWIGDGFADCEDQQYGADLTCYDDDGGDCLDPECGDDNCNGDETYDTCPEDCEAPSDDCADCDFDWTNYGSECCDTAWDEYGLDCATLTADYG